MRFQNAVQLKNRLQANLAKTGRVLGNLSSYRERTARARQISSTTSDPITQDAVRLQDQGYIALPFQDSELETTIGACRTVIAEREGTAARTGKAFFAQMLERSDFSRFPTLLRTALNIRVLETLAASYGRLPYLESIELLASYPTGKPELLQSQLWHCDETDIMVVKQLIYIEDVGPSEGPFALMPPKESSKVSSLSPHYLSDAEIGKMADIDKVVTLEGPAGARYLVDTGRCYHYGSRVEKPRYALFIYYNTGYGKYPRLGQWRGTPAETMQWQPLQRAALDL